MTEPDFTRAEKTATRLLTHQRPYSLVTDVRKLRYNKMILFDSMQHYAAVSHQKMDENVGEGCTLVYKNCSLILYDARQSNPRRLNFTLAHEVGHVCLEHQNDSAVEEIEANIFAAQLLMPEIVVLHLMKSGYNTIQSVKDAFYVSSEAARIKLCTIYRKGSFFWGPDEMKLLELYEESIKSFISEQKLKKVQGRLYPESTRSRSCSNVNIYCD